MTTLVNAPAHTTTSVSNAVLTGLGKPGASQSSKAFLSASSAVQNAPVWSSLTRNSRVSILFHQPEQVAQQDERAAAEGIFEGADEQWHDDAAPVGGLLFFLLSALGLLVL